MDDATAYFQTYCCIQKEVMKTDVSDYYYIII